MFGGTLLFSGEFGMPSDSNANCFWGCQRTRPFMQRAHRGNQPFFQIPHFPSGESHFTFAFGERHQFGCVMQVMGDTIKQVCRSNSNFVNLFRNGGDQLPRGEMRLAVCDSLEGSRFRRSIGLIGIHGFGLPQQAASIRWRKTKRRSLGDTLSR